MRAVVQRVLRAELRLVQDGAETTHSKIGAGLVVLVGIETGDTERELEWMCEKIARLRIFKDDADKMNLSVLDISGSALLVPNFTVAGSAKKGRRPSFVGAMAPTQAEPMFNDLIEKLRSLGVPTESGVFGAHMRVELINDGPVTIWLDSHE